MRDFTVGLIAGIGLGVLLLVGLASIFSLTGCATVPPPPPPVVAAPACPPMGPTVLFGHEIDVGRTQIVICKWNAEEESLLCLPARKERTL